MKVNPFSHHEQALKLRAFRNEILSSNIANADTPHYKARDFEFTSALREAGDDRLRLRRTSELHQAARDANGQPVDVKYRVPTQPTLDGNTVETDLEQARFAENTVRYRASLSFLNGSINGLRYAIKGGE